jgi:hypothetical protein
MTYRFPVTITDVFERKEKRHIRGSGDNAVFDTCSAGWYIQLDGLTSIYVGTEPPKERVGTQMDMILKSRPDPQAG